MNPYKNPIFGNESFLTFGLEQRLIYNSEISDTSQITPPQEPTAEEVEQPLTTEEVKEKFKDTVSQLRKRIYNQECKTKQALYRLCGNSRLVEPYEAGIEEAKGEFERAIKAITEYLEQSLEDLTEPSSKKGAMDRALDHLLYVFDKASNEMLEDGEEVSQNAEQNTSCTKNGEQAARMPTKIEAIGIIGMLGERWTGDPQESYLLKTPGGLPFLGLKTDEQGNLLIEDARTKQPITLPNGEPLQLRASGTPKIQSLLSIHYYLMGEKNGDFTITQIGNHKVTDDTTLEKLFWWTAEAKQLQISQNAASPDSAQSDLLVSAAPKRKTEITEEQEKAEEKLNTIQDSLESNSPDIAVTAIRDAARILGKENIGSIGFQYSGGGVGGEASVVIYGKNGEKLLSSAPIESGIGLVKREAFEQQFYKAGLPKPPSGISPRPTQQQEYENQLKTFLETQDEKFLRVINKISEMKDKNKRIRMIRGMYSHLVTIDEKSRNEFISMLLENIEDMRPRAQEVSNTLLNMLINHVPSELKDRIWKVTMTPLVNPSLDDLSLLTLQEAQENLGPEAQKVPYTEGKKYQVSFPEKSKLEKITYYKFDNGLEVFALYLRDGRVKGFLPGDNPVRKRFMIAELYENLGLGKKESQFIGDRDLAGNFNIGDLLVDKDTPILQIIAALDTLSQS